MRKGESNDHFYVNRALGACGRECKKKRGITALALRGAPFPPLFLCARVKKGERSTGERLRISAPSRQRCLPFALGDYFYSRQFKDWHTPMVLHHVEWD